MTKMEIGGVAIDYDDQGAGTPLVLAHGFCGNKDVWWQVAPELSRHHRVIALSHRGMGNSSQAPDGNYSLQAMASDLHTLVQGLNIRHPVIVGHSMGGAIAMTYYFSYPEDCGALVLYGTLPDMSTPPKVGPWGPQCVEYIQRRGLKAYLEEFLGYWLTPHAGPELRERLMQESLRTPDRVAAALWQEMPRFNVSHRLGEVGVPTLVIVGGEDRRTPVSESERMNRHIPHCWLRVIKGASHYVHLEKPQEFTEALLSFMRICGR